MSVLPLGWLDFSGWRLCCRYEEVAVPSSLAPGGSGLLFTVFHLATAAARVTARHLEALLSVLTAGYEAIVSFGPLPSVQAMANKNISLAALPSLANCCPQWPCLCR